MTKITEKDIPPPLEKPPKKQKPKQQESKKQADVQEQVDQEACVEIHEHLLDTTKHEEKIQEPEKPIQTQASEDLLRKYEEVLERLNKQVAEPVKPKVKKRPKRKPQVRIVEQWNEPQVVQAIATNSNDRLYRQIFYRRK